MSCLDTRRSRRRVAAVVLTVAAASAAGLGATEPSPSAREWHQAAGHRWAEAKVPVAGRAGFTQLAPAATGIAFTNHLAELSAALNRILENGSGVALGDVDGDGWCDIYFCRLEGDNVLYRNLGNWRFADVTTVTTQAGVACPNQLSTGAALEDLDGDSDLDLLVNALGGGTREFLNDGRGVFTELTGSRLARRFGATSLALADIDGDGDLDLYVTNYRTDTYNDRPPGLTVVARREGDRIVVTPEDRFIPLTPRAGGVEVVERGDRDFLYVNDGGGRFLPVSWTSGSFLDESGEPLKVPPTDWGLSVMFRDFNQDGLPDIFVCNDFFFWPDRIWLNDGGARFRAAPRHGFRNLSVSSMGGDFADINRDGHDDLFTADMVSRWHAWRHRQRPNLMLAVLRQDLANPEARPEVPRNVLQLSRGDGTFAEIAPLVGVDYSEWSWGGVFLDVDLDGWEDLIVPTGSNRDVQDADAMRAEAIARRGQSADTPETRLGNSRFYPPLRTPMLGFRNQRDLSFREAGPEWGFGETGPWQGTALADLDNDGDLDLVVNRLNGAAGLFRNEATAPRVAVRLRGEAPNTRGIGARLRVTGGPVEQMQEMIAGGRYVSDDDDLRVFAAGAPTNRLRIEVTWRDGRVSVVEDARPNRVYEIGQAGSTPRPRPAAPAVEPLFEDASQRLQHRHAPKAEDDFARQPLLSRKVSTAMPGVACQDLDGDGRDDLVVMEAPGWATTFRNTADGFQVATNLALAPPLSWWAGLFTGSPMPADLPEHPGAACLADVDADGDLDLFIASQPQPGRYPEAGPARLFLNREGRLEPDIEGNRALADAGLVNGAVFTDLTDDGFPELVLAGEWGPVRLFRNDHGRLARWDPPVETTSRLAARPSSLAQLTGWWNSVAAGDFDGDGRMDLALANWGRNTRYQRYLARPLRLYFGDFDADGVFELLETYFEPELKKHVPWRDYETVSRSMPFVGEHAASFKAFGEAGVEELLGERLPDYRFDEAATLDSVVLLNRGDRFEVRPLPLEAQFAPAFGVTVADFDGNGAEDLFLAQNFFGVEPETARYDAGRGLLLRGDGHGGWTALPGPACGIAVYGEQRASAVADFDADGRSDLVVTQHGGETRLFRNRRARPGLRVRLAGPPGNPAGIGAQVRVGVTGSWGPAREIHAGTGWLSSDSPVVVLAAPAVGDARLWVRWPGGRVAEQALPAGTREALISAPATGAKAH